MIMVSWFRKRFSQKWEDVTQATITGELGGIFGGNSPVEFIAALQKNNFGEYRVKLVGESYGADPEYIMRKFFWQHIQEDKLKGIE
jgi:hypothetical protein